MLKNNVLSAFLLLSIFVLGFSACDDDDGDATPISEQTIAEVVANDPNFSILRQALDQALLTSTLDGNTDFTVFAPTDAAFQNAGIDLNTISDADLTETLLYHVLSSVIIRSTDLQEGQTYASTATATGPDDTQLSLLVERAGTSVTLNGSVNVTSADLITRNGVIHVIDAVLTPLDVVGHAVANSNFTTLVGALGSADGDLVDLLQTDGPFTVFAPLNSAFSDIQATVDGLSTADLAKVLLYHVVSGANVRESQVSPGAITTANEGTTFNASSLDPLQVTDANGGVSNIVLTDVQGTNGVIHVLDAVLIPGNL